MKLFYCYSPNLKRYLINEGSNYLHSGQHQKTKRIFWVFEGDEKLNRHLDEWRLKSNLRN